MRTHGANSGQSMDSRMSRLLCVLSLCLLLVGCSSSKFTATTRVDLTPFADQTIALVDQAGFELFQRQAEAASLLTRYLDLETPEVEAYITCRQQMFALAQQMMNYSLKIAALSTSNISDAEQVMAFAEYIENLGGATVISESEITPEGFQRMLTDIRQQTALLDALRMAQPLINEEIRYFTTLFQRAEQLAEPIREQIAMNIDTRNADLLRFMDLIQERKALALRAIELIDSARPDQIEILKEALARNKLDPADFLTFSNLSLDEALKIEQLLLNRLEIVERIRRQIDPELQDYHATHHELDQAFRNFYKRLNTARVRLFIWSKAHQKMAAGVKDPAQWFDMSDIGGELSDLVGKALDKAL